MASRFGATQTVRASGGDAARQLLALTGGKGVDTAIEAVGIPITFELCQEIVAPGGVIANIGVHGVKADLHLEKLWSQNIAITTRLVDTVTTPMLLKTVQAGKIDPKKLITHRFSLDRIGEAYETFSRAADTHALKVIIETGSALTIPAEAMANDFLDTALMTHTGLMLHVRAVKPEDEPLLAEFFRHVTPEDLRFRFLGGVREVSHERLLAMTKVDHVTTEHFLAFSGGSDAIIAAALVACDPSMTKAEVAISVRADDKHKGVGWEMLRHVARYAQAHGVKTLESLESRENHEAIELEQEQGFVAVPYPDDPTLVLIRKDLRST